MYFIPRSQQEPVPAPRRTDGHLYRGLHMWIIARILVAPSNCPTQSPVPRAIALSNPEAGGFPPELLHTRCKIQRTVQRMVSFEPLRAAFPWLFPLPWFQHRPVTLYGGLNEEGTGQQCWFLFFLFLYFIIIFKFLMFSSLVLIQAKSPPQGSLRKDLQSLTSPATLSPIINLTTTPITPPYFGLKIGLSSFF